MKFFIILVMMVMSTIAQGQTAIATSGNVTAEVKVSTGQTKTTKTSISVSNSDDSYSLHATFDNFRTKNIEKLLSENLDKNLFSTDKNTKIWKKENNGQTAYSFVLKEGRLKVSIDKELISKSTFEKLETLGERISETLSDN